MSETPGPHRPRLQFGLGSLLVAVALSALPLALLHYWLDGPEFVRLLVGASTGILAAVVGFTLLVIAPCAIILALAWWWNSRSRQPSFGGLILRMVVICVGVYELLLLWAYWSSPDF